MTSDHRRLVVAGLVLISLLAWLGFSASGPSSAPAPVSVISQKGRAFSMTRLDISAGDSIRIVNDDADLDHHAYVESPKFRFDSGDQRPGSSTDIQFTVPGTFSVLCGIHPKMRITVNVK
jgi:plastocyanin